MALALQGSLVVRYADPAVADAFCASRLDGDWGRAFGTLPAGIDARRSSSATGRSSSRSERFPVSAPRLANCRKVAVRAYTL